MMTRGDEAGDAAPVGSRNESGFACASRNGTRFRCEARSLRVQQQLWPRAASGALQWPIAHLAPPQRHRFAAAAQHVHGVGPCPRPLLRAERDAGRRDRGRPQRDQKSFRAGGVQRGLDHLAARGHPRGPAVHVHPPVLVRRHAVRSEQQQERWCSGSHRSTARPRRLLQGQRVGVGRLQPLVTEQHGRVAHDPAVGQHAAAGEHHPPQRGWRPLQLGPSRSSSRL